MPPSAPKAAGWTASTRIATNRGSADAGEGPRCRRSRRAPPPPVSSRSIPCGRDPARAGWHPARRFRWSRVAGSRGASERVTEGDVEVEGAFRRSTDVETEQELAVVDAQPTACAGVEVEELAVVPLELPDPARVV